MDCIFLVRDGDGSIHQELVDRATPFATLFTKLKQEMGLENFSLFYNDEEGDEVRISSDAELRECFDIAVDDSVTFYVVPQPVSTEPSKEESRPEPVQFSPEWIGKQIPVLQQFVGEFLKKEHPLGNLISEITGESCTDLEKMASNAFSELSREVTKVQKEFEEEPKEAKPVEDFPVVHSNVYCDVCNEEIIGIRYKCVNCVDYDLCQNCEEVNLKSGHHDPEHLFLKVYKPVSLPIHRGFPSFYNRPAGSHGWMGWNPRDKRSCPWRRCHSERKEKHHGRKDKFRELEENMKELQRELSILKGAKGVEAPVVDVEVPVVEPEVPVVEEVNGKVVVSIAPEPEVKEENLMEQSTAGFSPELLEVFEQIVALGFKDYPRIAELVRQFDGDVNAIVMQLLNEMRQSVSA